MKYIILLAIFYQYGNAQISGRIISEGSPNVILQTTLLQTGTKTNADFDGYFSIPIPDKLDRYDVVIESGSMTFKIENITMAMHNIKMDSIELPTLKNISFNEYKGLAEIEKIKYIAVYHWTNIIGYLDKFTLSHNYISFYCDAKKYKVDDFTFDPEIRTIAIDAKNLIKCDE